MCIWDLSESFFGGVRLGCNYGGRWIIGFDFLNASVGLYSIYIYVYIYTLFREMGNEYLILVWLV